MSYLDSLSRKETMGIDFERGFERYLPNKRATVCVWRLLIFAWLICPVEVII